MIVKRLPLFVTSRPAAAVLAAAFAGFALSEYRMGKRRPRAGSVNRDNGSGRAVGRGLALAYGGGLVLSVASPATVVSRHPRTIFVAGLTTAALGQALRLASARKLGESFTFKVHTHPEQLVVQTGPYRLIRHPSYTGALICALGFSIAYGNWLSPVMVSFLAGGYVHRIPSEEAAMLEGIGEGYAEYMTRSKRLIPFIF
ncbi:isoprenylcysteine carboxylmethyltransferase family protein [Rhodococcus sp. KRD175]|uniref:methyltransferase family protein n=1 Tax=Rhodococcus sp. KRD175 TaxID=2729729 RepID=UPI0019D0E075|nr:isoprenylcysteine carboxylmethyltransferase family protein [Rhodococcus sp. KRD175]